MCGNSRTFAKEMKGKRSDLPTHTKDRKLTNIITN